MRESTPHPDHESAGYRALRRGRNSAPGQSYLLTFVTRQRRPLFGDPHCARAAAHMLTRHYLWKGSTALAWVLMPDHYHCLADLGEGDTLEALVNRLKSGSARAVNRARGLGGAVWQAGFHDHALRSDEVLLTTARYVVANPLRAGLVSRIGDYPYWDACWLGHTGPRDLGL